jgi:hypothetical protein
MFEFGKEIEFIMEYFSEESITLAAKDKLEELKKKGVNTTALDMCILSEEKYPIQLAAVDELFALCDKAKKAELYRQDRDAYKQAYENICVFYKQLVAANQKLAESHEAVEHQMQRTTCMACGDPLVDGICANQSCAKFVPLI